MSSTTTHPASFRLYNDAKVISANVQNVSGVNDLLILPTVNTTIATPTLTPQQIADFIYINGVGGATSITFPTAAAIVQAFPNIQPGWAVEFVIANISGSTVTLVANTGVTLTETTIHTGLSKRFFIYFVSTIPLSEAITVY